MAAIQHYVPRFLLRNFCTGKKPKLWAYDKSTAKSFETNIQNVAGERDFYEAEIGDRILSLEEGLSAMESKTAAIIDRILAKRSIGDLSDDDRVQIAVFVAIQMRRVPNQREHLIAMKCWYQESAGRPRHRSGVGRWFGRHHTRGGQGDVAHDARGTE